MLWLLACVDPINITDPQDTAEETGLSVGGGVATGGVPSVFADCKATLHIADSASGDQLEYDWIFQYDSEGRLQTEWRPAAENAEGDVRIDYYYNDDNTLDREHWEYSRTHSFEFQYGYQYDAEGRLIDFVKDDLLSTPGKEQVEESYHYAYEMDGHSLRIRADHLGILWFEAEQKLDEQARVQWERRVEVDALGNTLQTIREQSWVEDQLSLRKTTLERRQADTLLESSFLGEVWSFDAHERWMFYDTYADPGLQQPLSECSYLWSTDWQWEQHCTHQEKPESWQLYKWDSAGRPLARWNAVGPQEVLAMTRQETGPGSIVVLRSFGDAAFWRSGSGDGGGWRAGGGARGGVGRKGARLVLVDVDRERLEKVASRNKALMWEKVDVADAGAMEGLAARVEREWGGASLVINNAGLTVVGRFEEHSIADWQRVMGVNFFGVLHGCQAFLPQLRRQKRGWIVNISSMFGLLGVPGQSAYCASKYAVRGLSESLWEELRGSSVGLTLVHPGGIRTRIMEDARWAGGQAGDTETLRSLSRFFQLRTLPPEKAAARILSAVESEQQRLLICPEAIATDWLRRIAPEYGNRAMVTLMERMMGLGEMRKKGLKGAPS